MTTKTLVKHGSNSGYRAEMALSGKACDRCHKAHLMYSRKAFRTKGYTSQDVIDHLYTPGSNRPDGHNYRVNVPRVTSAKSSGSAESVSPGLADTGQPSTGQAFADKLSGLVGLTAVRKDGTPDDASYVAGDDAPEYLSSVDPDPEPEGEEYGPPVGEGEWIINEAGQRKIEENLGTYLSVVGMTAEMIDGYCGRVLAQNLDEMVKRWSKVIAHYPAAAKLFLDSKGGAMFLWIGALQATWPVLYAIYEHHLSGSVKVQNGKVVRPDMNGQFPDATMPPQPDFAYTAR